MTQLIFVMSVFGLVISPSVQAMKCWKNNEGVTECGTSVPPEFAQQGHKEIGKSGMVKEEVERAKTPEELAEEERLAKLEAEKQKAAEEQALKDRILTETFSSVEDIEKARDDRITALESTIKLAETRNQKIQVDLDKRIASAAADERAGKKPAEALLNDIDSLKRQIKNNDDFIAEKKLEQDAIRESHAKDIARYIELKGT
ncbi:MAG: hypothetical protein AAF410_03260 [Pseudomonadota bacterium]